MFDVGKLGLKKGTLVLIDSAPIIYLIEGKGDRAVVVGAFMEAARKGKLRLAVSSIAWTECLIGVLDASDAERAAQFRRLLSDSSVLVVEPVDAAIAEEAARILSLPGPPGFADAFHLATAAVIGAAAVLTNDDAWQKHITAAGIKTPAANGKYQPPRALIVDELAFDIG